MNEFDFCLPLTCEDSQYVNGNECADCSENCLECEDQTGFCLECDSNYEFISSRCGCPTGLEDNGWKCDAPA